MTKKTVADLEQAIWAVLVSTKETDDPNYLKIPRSLLRMLQSEYNIYFREPDTEQLDTIKYTKPYYTKSIQNRIEADFLKNKQYFIEDTE